MTAEILKFKPRVNDSFGLCPTCKAEPALLNIEKANFAYCREHKLYWSIGWNLLGSWRHESVEDWQRNRETLDAAYAVEPFHYARRKRK